MRTLILLAVVFLSANALSHEIQFVGQHIKLNRQSDSAWQSDILARATLSPKWDMGMQATYLERFDLYENRLGAMAFYRHSPTVKIEARYFKGEEGVEILPRDHYLLTLYHSVTTGISPYFTYQNALYSSTHLQSIRFGVEIEKIRKIILIPMLMIGQTQLKDPGEVREVNSFGMKAFYYEELNYFFSIFGFKGIDISQAVVSQSGETITTTTGGLSAGMWFFSNLKAEFIFDYTDYEELNNQFITSSLNLVWGF